ncbi:meiotic recombination protein REC8 homolog [Palaemon carinicauda]|uniref:meiotic recombination protein REC8 homolog n=1 Tax=Palaemon carinicauda TaxID=392227 RepID=UPI0035B5F803
MFYSYDVLNPQNGKFAVIWLVATGHLRYANRRDKNFKEIMSLKVSRTCNDIIRHIDQRGHGERPKFSLYLSSMLFYGTVKVYHRQVRFLLEEVMNIHKNLQRQSALILDLDAPIPGAQRVTLHSPATLEGLEGVHFTDLDDFLAMPPPPRIFLETPRKHALLTPLKKKGQPSAEPSPARVEETLRKEQEEDREDITLLLRDWEETPTRARAEDITLREETLQATQPFGDVALAAQTLGPLDLGPPFYMLEGPLATLPVQPELDLVRKRLDLDGREEQQQQVIDGDRREEQERTLPPSEAPPGPQAIEPQQAAGERIPEERVLQELFEEPPLILPQDQQPPVGQVGEPAPEQQPSFAEPPPVRPPKQTRGDGISKSVEATPQKEPARAHPERPEKAPPVAPDITPVARPQPEVPSSDASQIRLSPVDQAPRRTQARVPKRRKLIIDAEIHLTRAEIRDQCQNTKIALRCEEPEEDAVDIRSLKFMDAQKLFSSQPHRNIMARPLKELITRHYRVLQEPTDQNQRGYCDLSPEAKRQLRMPGARAAPGEVSDLADASAVSALESSKESGRRSFLQISTGQHEASTVAGLISELIPIQEEQAAEPQQDGTEPFLINGAPIEPPPVVDFPVPSDVGSRPKKGEGIRKGPKRSRELDETITLASPKKTPVPRETTFGLFESPPATHRRGPPPSPMGGLQHVTVEAEIHAPSR